MKQARNLLYWGVIVIGLAFLLNIYQIGSSDKNIKDMDFSEFMDNVENGKIASVEISGPDIISKNISGETFYTYSPSDPNMIDALRKAGVKIKAKPLDDSSGLFWNFVFYFLPVLLLIGFWLYFMKQSNSGNNKAMSFGNSKAKLIKDTKSITFKDVAGIEESKQELEEIIDFLKDPAKFQRLGGKIPRGVLLIGPPGTGKTLLAKAVAGEAEVPFFSISGSDFVEMFVGVGASRVRDMFVDAKKHAPCILFIDEIDAVGRHRGSGYGGGNDEREQTLNQLLVEMDGFEGNQNVIVIAATNRSDVLDKALLRPGRFDRQVVVSLPDVKGREAILEVHTKKTPLAKDVKLSVIARGTPGFSGADLANLVNEAALLAARKNRVKITSIDFEEARDKVMMGNERKSASLGMSEEEKSNTAYHEAGHAICALYVKECDPIHKATIIPRGQALGMVQTLPEKDQYSFSRVKAHSRLILAMGGRVAEEIKHGYDKLTSGASSDIAGATRLARAMVEQWGMSDKLGPVLLTSDNPYARDISEETAKLVDDEVRRFVMEAENEAKKILKEHNKEFELLAQALIEYETLTGDEIQKVIKGEKLDSRDDSPVPEEKRTKASIPEL